MPRRLNVEIGKRQGNLTVKYTFVETGYTKNFKKKSATMIVAECDCGRERKFAGYNLHKYYNCGHPDCPHKKPYVKRNLSNGIKRKYKEKKQNIEKNPMIKIVDMEKEKAFKYLVKKGLATDKNVEKVYSSFRREYLSSKDMF